jgi:hypothetical protein
MIEGKALEIARFLATKAALSTRTTYEEVATEVGWGHPTGRGLGKFLYEIMHHCKANLLPPITLIVVKKGARLPSADALPHIRAALGDIDIEVAQKDVFSFDWQPIPEFAFPNTQLPDGRPIWLTSFWGFTPESGGCLGFTSQAHLNSFIRRTKPGVLVAIYVTKDNGSESERGKVVGIIEVSHEKGHLREFISGDQWAKNEQNSSSRGKWLHALRTIRAWRVAKEEWQDVDQLFPETFKSANPQFIGAQGIPIHPNEIKGLLNLTVYEVPVYGQTKNIESGLETLSNALVPSKAVYPAKEPYWVGETDGPKHLYILRLTGGVANYLGRPSEVVDDKMIVKVGFSKSPLSRRDQIQAAYPIGAYRWEVLYPREMPPNPPYPNAAVAIAGEDAMKARLVNDGAECLGGEFFLAEEGLVIRTWAAGNNAANEKKQKE